MNVLDYKYYRVELLSLAFNLITLWTNLFIMVLTYQFKNTSIVINCIIRKNIDVLSYFLRTILFQYFFPLDRGSYCNWAHNSSFIIEKVTSMHRSCTKNRGSIQCPEPIEEHTAFIHQGLQSTTIWSAFRLNEPMLSCKPICMTDKKGTFIHLSPSCLILQF